MDKKGNFYSVTNIYRYKGVGQMTQTEIYVPDTKEDEKEIVFELLQLYLDSDHKKINHDLLLRIL